MLYNLGKFESGGFKIEKTKEEEQMDGLKMHAGMDETSGILYLRKDLVSEDYKNAKPLPGNDMKSLIEISSQKDWPGYFGSEGTATAELGRKAWKNNVRDFSEFIISIIEGNINPDTVQRFGDVATSPEDRLLDSLSLHEEARRRKMQIDWILANDLN